MSNHTPIIDFVFSNYALGIYQKYARFSNCKLKLLNSKENQVVTRKDWEVSRMMEWVESLWVYLSLFINWDEMPENIKQNLVFKKHNNTEFSMNFVDIVKDWLKVYYTFNPNPILLDLSEVATSISKMYFQPEKKDYQLFLFEINEKVVIKQDFLETYKFYS